MSIVTGSAPPMKNATAEVAVRIANLSHAYGNRRALNELSLDVRRGEIFGLLGPNGSGKTTLFRILSTLIPIEPGKVSLFGVDLGTNQNAVRQMIGVVFQSPSLDKQLTARENLMHQGHLYGLRGADLAQRIDQQLARVKLLDRQHERVSTFSGGMRRRVEIAKGLLHRPKLLLLDEPSTGLDPAARIDLWQTLEDVRINDGATVLLTTHLMEEADLCDRLAILDRGVRLACDTPAALKSMIGGDVIRIETASPAEDAALLRERLSIDAQPIDHTIRIELANGSQWLPKLIEALPGKVESITLNRPTLRDVFIKLTGRTMNVIDTDNPPS